VDQNLHIDIIEYQSSKNPIAPCGDVVSFERNESGTIIIVCDGIGSGFKAHIAAKMCVSRIKGLLKRGFSLRKTFSNVVKTMEQWKSPKNPYCAFTLARIRNDGEVTILSYEAPTAILLSSTAVEIPQRTFVVDGIIAKESNCFLIPSEGLILISDGISQSGLGRRLPLGWTGEMIAQYITDLMRDNVDRKLIAHAIHDKGLSLCNNIRQDDCTVVYASCRVGKSVNIFTGPPSNKNMDKRIVTNFLDMPGPKVVCGATTAAIVARQSNCKLDIEHQSQSLLAPPRYYIDGINLVTEGAVTLNQLCNIIDVDPCQFEEDSGVTDLYSMLKNADKINFILGMGLNPVSGDISFCQKGILTRDKIVPLIAEKLRAKGKLVLITKV